MNQLLIPILIALAVACLAWWCVWLFGSLTDSEQRKLQKRLSNDAEKSDSPGALSITLPDEVKMPEFLARKPFIQTLARKLLQVAPDVSLRKFLVISACCAVAGAVTAEAFNCGIVVIACCALGSGYLPVFLLNMRHAKRQKAVMMQLPEALDFLARVMRAGHSLSTGFQMMSEELPAPLSTEFRKCYDQHSLGQPLEDGLRDMSQRIDSTDFHFFVTAVLIQRQTGGDLSEVLSNISGLVRERIRLQRHVRAKTAEGRFTGYIMVAFPAVMFCICYAMNSENYGKFFSTHMGMVLLCTAVGLQMMGLFMIKKLTTVKV